MSKSHGPLLRLRLYVAGRAPNSQLAVSHLERAMAQRDPCTYDLEIVDVMRQPEVALEHGILVTPTLVRVAPPPERRIVGNLSDLDSLEASLEPA